MSSVVSVIEARPSGVLPPNTDGVAIFSDGPAPVSRRGGNFSFCCAFGPSVAEKMGNYCRKTRESEHAAGASRLRRGQSLRCRAMEQILGPGRFRVLDVGWKRVIEAGGRRGLSDTKRLVYALSARFTRQLGPGNEAMTTWL